MMIMHDDTINDSMNMVQVKHEPSNYYHLSLYIYIYLIMTNNDGNKMMTTFMMMLNEAHQCSITIMFCNYHD